MGQKNGKGIPTENPNAPHTGDNSLGSHIANANNNGMGMLYNHDENGARVGFDDFEILKLVGKGSLTHLLFLYLHVYMCVLPMWSLLLLWDVVATVM